jgi:5-methylcytosine-specific restriction endonuclease McrA
VPRSRVPWGIWVLIRARIWNRDARNCRHCGTPVGLDSCHIDHIRSGKLATNAQSNLRTLCRRCHVLRADSRHRGMIASALRDRIIPSNWREFIWDG